MAESVLPNVEPAATEDVDLLKRELAKTKEQLRTMRESNCLHDIQLALNTFQCQLVPLPDGRFHVKAMEPA